MPLSKQMAKEKTDPTKRHKASKYFPGHITSLYKKALNEVQILDPATN